MSFTTKTELAQKMGMSLRTFQRRLKAANLNVPRGLICPKLQQDISDKLNNPDSNNGHILARNVVKCPIFNL
jgi:hypothetical protein